MKWVNSGLHISDGDSWDPHQGFSAVGEGGDFEALFLALLCANVV